MFKPSLTAAAAILLTVLPALVHGVYSRRWVEPTGAKDAAAVIELLPAELGDWKLLAEEKPLTDFVQQELALSCHISRSYQNEYTGQVVGILLMGGRPGPLVRHPPTICYENKANRQIGADEWLEPAGAEGVRLKLLKYEPPSNVLSERFFIAYGHTTDTTWDAPAFPRIAYGSAGLLHKVQMLTTIGPPKEEAKARAGLEDFAEQFAAGFRKLIAGSPDPDKG